MAQIQNPAKNNPIQDTATDPSNLQIDMPVRVRYNECDPMNLVHHATYPVWMEMARTELLRSRGIHYKELEEQGIFIVVAKLNIRFSKPAFYDDELIVRCTMKPTAGIKIEHEYKILRDNKVIASAETVVACVNHEGKAQPVPEFLRQN
ncbi:acyl-CoA thioesterase [Poriferisphaera sp. WC338]|uniref:acyl-CoA thioesterase n=1 Tax=Poriferisphaera sp. WC338 TaxID=3425129 RepID=UPI003D815B67